MNIGELKDLLNKYPDDLSVATDITNGYAVLANDVSVLYKEDKPVVLFLTHHSSDSYFDEDAVRLEDIC